MNFLKNHTRSTSIHLGLFENMVPHICLMRKNHVPQCSPKKYSHGFGCSPPLEKGQTQIIPCCLYTNTYT